MKSYQDLLRRVLTEGEPHADRTGVGTTSLFGVQVEHDMRLGFPLLTTKRVPLRWIFQELKWFLSGSSQVADLQAHGVDIWDEWADEATCARFGRKPGDLGHIYGPLWRNFEPGVVTRHNDQILDLLRDMQASPNSRRLIVTGWNPNHCRDVALPPCHTLWQVKLHSDGIGMSLHLFARSIDMVLGYPFDIALYGMLLEMLAWVTGRAPRRLVFTISDCHIYDNHADAVKTILSRAPYPLPEVRIKDYGYSCPEEKTPEGQLDALLAMRWEDVELTNYKHWPKIKADVAI